MKWICLILVICLFLTPTVSATQTYDPGLITADSPLWKADIVLEEIMERFMWSDNARVELQLKHANERIGELQTSTDSNEVIQEYVQVLNRIESAQNLRYETSVSVKNQLEQHGDILRGLSQETPEITNDVILQLTQTRNTVQNQTHFIINEEQMWWSEKVTEFNILPIPTIVDEQYDKYTQQLPEGMTVVDVVRSDGVIVQSYTIRNEEGVVSIQTGTTDNYAEKYTFTINQLQKYEAML